MCGPGPVMAMLTATSLLGAKKATLLKYATPLAISPVITRQWWDTPQ